MMDYDFDVEASKLYQLRNKVLLQYATSADPALRAKYDRLLLEKKLRKGLAESVKYDEYKAMGRVDLIPYSESELNLEEKNVKKLHDAMKINYKVDSIKPPPQPLQPPASFLSQVPSAQDQQLMSMFMQMQQSFSPSGSLQAPQNQFQNGFQMPFPGLQPHQANFPQAQLPQTQFSQPQFPQLQFPQPQFPQAQFPQGQFSSPQFSPPHLQGKNFGSKKKKAKLDY